MKVEHEPVGLRELRHNTSEVLSRVRRGETVDVTEYGRLIARIVPVQERKHAILRRMEIPTFNVAAAPWSKTPVHWITCRQFLIRKIRGSLSGCSPSNRARQRGD